MTEEELIEAIKLLRLNDKSSPHNSPLRSKSGSSTGGGPNKKASSRQKSGYTAASHASSIPYSAFTSRIGGRASGGRTSVSAVQSGSAASGSMSNMASDEQILNFAGAGIS